MYNFIIFSLQCSLENTDALFSSLHIMLFIWWGFQNFLFTFNFQQFESDISWWFFSYSFTYLTFIYFFFLSPVCLTLFGEGNGNPLQYSCLENPMDRGAWWAAVHGVPRSRTRLSDFTLFFSLWCIGEGNGNPLQCSCRENPRDGGSWWAAIYGVAQSQTRLKRLSSVAA